MKESIVPKLLLQWNFPKLNFPQWNFPSGTFSSGIFLSGVFQVEFSEVEFSVHPLITIKIKMFGDNKIGLINHALP